MISDGGRNVLGADMVVRQSRPNATTASSEVKAFTSSESDKKRRKLSMETKHGILYNLVTCGTKPNKK